MRPSLHGNCVSKSLTLLFFHRSYPQLSWSTCRPRPSCSGRAFLTMYSACCSQQTRTARWRAQHCRLCIFWFAVSSGHWLWQQTLPTSYHSCLPQVRMHAVAMRICQARCSHAAGGLGNPVDSEGVHVRIVLQQVSSGIGSALLLQASGKVPVYDWRQCAKGKAALQGLMKPRSRHHQAGAVEGHGPCLVCDSFLMCCWTVQDGMQVRPHHQQGLRLTAAATLLLQLLPKQSMRCLAWLHYWKRRKRTWTSQQQRIALLCVCYQCCRMPGACSNSRTVIRSCEQWKKRSVCVGCDRCVPHNLGCCAAKDTA